MSSVYRCEKNKMSKILFLCCFSTPNEGRLRFGIFLGRVGEIQRFFLDF
jgi:hypothetical protein